MAFSFEIAAERKIQEAIEEGVFDNIPGKGLPLNLDSDAAIPPELRAANRILKNSNAAPDWIQLNRAIRDLRAEFSAEQEGFKKRFAGYQSRMNDAKPNDVIRIRRELTLWYKSTVDKMKRSMAEVNLAIQKYNLIAPTCTHNHIPYRVDEEIERISSSYPCPTGSDL